jgi:hypothetical protein
MNPSMDDRRILAEIERRLARDDPELASLMDALNHQFPHDQDDADERNDGERRDWRVKAAVALAILAVVGMILTAIFTKPPPADDNHGPPNGPAAAVSTRTQRRGHRSRTAPEQRRPGNGARQPNSQGANLMRARDLAEPCVSVSTDADAVDAVRLLVEQGLPGLLVVDPAGRPYAILPACDMVRTLVPSYVQEDPVLAAVIDEPHADHLCRALAGRKVADCLPVGRPFLPTPLPTAPPWSSPN